MRASGKLSQGSKTAIIVVTAVFSILGVILLLNLQNPRKATVTTAPPPPSKSISKPGPEIGAPKASPPAATSESKPEPPAISAAPGTGSSVEGSSAVTEGDLEFLRKRNLLIPVEGIKANQLRDTFSQSRSEGRSHDAIDIMSSQGVPVLATTDGVVVKLFQSARGGITLYELDPSGLYAYYYAHLQSYADGIVEGKRLVRGETLGYVGDTGNAGPGNFHLHFAISKLTSSKKWSGGDPINPYPLLVK